VCNGLGRIFEFCGARVATLDVTQRTAICNMIEDHIPRSCKLAISVATSGKSLLN
jgi:hypothetical protein